MAITRQKKEEVVADLKEKLSKAKILLFTDYRGLKVKDMNAFRKDLQREGVDFHVVKKTLLKRVFDEIKLPLEVDSLEGQIALALGYKDEVKVPGLLYKFSKESGKLKILSGVLEGKEISKDEVITLAKLPSREELLGKFVFLVASPITNFVNVLQGNMRNLVLVLKGIEAEKRG